MWTDKDTCDALINIHKIDVDSPRNLYEAALAKYDLDQAYRLTYAHCEKYWDEAIISNSLGD